MAAEPVLELELCTPPESNVSNQSIKTGVEDVEMSNLFCEAEDNLSANTDLVGFKQLVSGSGSLSLQGFRLLRRVVEEALTIELRFNSHAGSGRGRDGGGGYESDVGTAHDDTAVS